MKGIGFADAMSKRGACQLRAYTPASELGFVPLKTVESIYNLERQSNNLTGFGEGSDYLPERLLKEPSIMPGS